MKDKMAAFDWAVQVMAMVVAVMIGGALLAYLVVLGLSLMLS